MTLLALVCYRISPGADLIDHVRGFHPPGRAYLRRRRLTLERGTVGESYDSFCGGMSGLVLGRWRSPSTGLSVPTLAVPISTIFALSNSSSVIFPSLWRRRRSERVKPGPLVGASSDFIHFRNATTAPNITTRETIRTSVQPRALPIPAWARRGDRRGIMLGFMLSMGRRGGQSGACFRDAAYRARLLRAGLGVRRRD